MGCDGVHYAILKIDGEIRDDSPVIQVSPVDFDSPYALLAPTFTDYLANGCGVSRKEIEDLLAAEKAGRSSLVEFMRSHFDDMRFWFDGEENDIGPYIRMIVPGPDGDQSPALRSTNDLTTDKPAGIMHAGDDVARLFPGHDLPERSSENDD
jgi:hypothetical protein